jgi:hypothetical protein
MRLFFSILLLLVFFSASADVIGRRRARDCSINFSDINTLQGYRLYWQVQPAGTVTELLRDTTVVLPGDRHERSIGWCWAVGNGQSTDTLQFVNNYSPDMQIRFKGIKKNRLKIAIRTTTNKNRKTATALAGWLGDVGDAGNKSLLAAAGAALLLLVFLALRKKRGAQAAMVLLFAAASLPGRADTPDKKRMNDSRAQFKNLTAFAEQYRFYVHHHYADTTIELRGDTTVVIPASGGAPDGILFWAVHRKTGASTDTVQYDNYYDPDRLLRLDSVVSGKLKLTVISDEEVLPVKAEGTPMGDVMPEKPGLSRVSKWLIVMAVLAMLGLAGWWIWRRRK